MGSNDLIPFKNKVVSDLHWALTSPNLIGGQYIEDTANPWEFLFSETRWQEVIVWLKELDDSPSPLIHFLNNKPTSKKLGKYFENLLWFAFEQLVEFKQVVHGLQVKRSKDNTIGEFDFLLQRTVDNSWMHMEVAVKFYLATDGKEELRFIGPNAKDRLDIKLDRLHKHQLELGTTPEGQKSLEQLGIDQYQRSLLVKGYLFYNLLHPARFPQPDFINPYCNKGWWSYFHEYPFDKHSHKSFVVLNKLEWLTKFIGGSDRVFTCTEIRQLIENKKIELPVLLAEVEEKGSAWVEVSRGFLIDRDWPSM
ncbi:MAG: hypothetical protein CL840_17670 [Crocinitomicaceae bacterium]|nr:hypothetical protein [Crocinitomicaceae bacterium]|tara:strand:+ start:2539 stop:3462 length:924 start_codon:yes stop_codon:yes gene_type:complete